jgi:hypothetical protein
VFDRQDDCESRPFFWNGCGEYPAIVVFRYLFAHRQADPDTLIFRLWMQALKYIEDLISIALFETNPVVGERQSDIMLRWSIQSLRLPYWAISS